MRPNSATLGPGVKPQSVAALRVGILPQGAYMQERGKTTGPSPGHALPERRRERGALDPFGQATAAVSVRAPASPTVARRQQQRQQQPQGPLTRRAGWCARGRRR
jgi:hypothetical protein